MVFDLIVVVMTTVRTIQINRIGGGHKLAHILMRDGESVS